ncbi:YhbY family RNA-binding protein [Desulfurococcus mucosus]|uniref:CRM domain-containing protein n=1 Tax=Desulfurococcus mucosus (strain ATCC 35584 / DSM 2162 / JCM 9187 / O7/1) TaxID=765177 RepID=E8RAB7_DESM0|nr:YhbY family RNA-binding protein [Desulfurococcus mucosus]ADV65423.1 protein of unknown function UPF0044 [Desulfurococcus mucosus DSM 2162]
MRVDEEVHDKGIRERIKARIAGKTDLQLGKNGLTQGFIDEVKLRLEKHGVVKIRVLKSFRSNYTGDLEELAERIAGLSGGRVYEVRGFTITLVATPRREGEGRPG